MYDTYYTILNFYPLIFDKFWIIIRDNFHIKHISDLFCSHIKSTSFYIFMCDYFSSRDIFNIKWAASSEFGTYRLCEQRRFRRACASAQSRQNLRCSLIQAVSQEEPSDRKPDPWPLWMAGHAQLKFGMTECSKTQIRLTRSKYLSVEHVWTWVLSHFSDSPLCAIKLFHIVKCKTVLLV